jgi:hypothetical protein
LGSDELLKHITAEARKKLEPTNPQQKKANLSRNEKPQRVNFDLGKRTTITIHEGS